MIYVEQCVDDDLERDQHDDDLFGRSTPSLVTHLEDVRMGGGKIIWSRICPWWIWIRAPWICPK